LAACERDDDPIGPATYKTLLHLLKLQGPDGYLATLMSRRGDSPRISGTADVGEGAG